MNPILREIAHRLQDAMHHTLGYLFPINSKKVFFDSFPDYSDNSRAMSDYLITHSEYEIYWAVNEIPSFNVDKCIHFVLKSNKYKCIYHTLTSKYLFSTHGAFPWANPQRQLYVCFWHGTMLKRIGCMQDPIGNKYNNRTVTKFTAPSNFYTEFFARSFNRENSDIIITGYPRINFLKEKNDSLDRLNIKVEAGLRVIMYLPTFRQPAGGGYVDTGKNVFKEDVIDFTSGESLSKWNNFFASKNIILLVKPHPSDKNQLAELKLSNIRIIPHSLLQEKDIQLYQVLHYADALITDFSSVFCDYLVLNRPIGFMLSDVNEYAQGRGFVFENPMEYLPGYKLFNESDFIDFCNDISDGIDKSKNEREKLQPIYNKYMEGDFCERIARFLNLSIKN